MRLSLHNFNSRNRLSLRLFAGALILSLFAAACGGSDDDLAAAAAAVDPVETNGGGILVKPPDVLEGDPAEPQSDLPSRVDGM